ncbi:hypothetical protein B0H13DRAFT_1937913, partial [Mycena leptocephala]
MASQKMLIPAPKNLKALESRKGTMPQLREAMGLQCWDLVKFNNFREAIWDSARIFGLDGLTRWEHENETNWKKLVQKLVNQYPDLKQYQDYWPVAMYFNRWVLHRKYLGSPPLITKDNSLKDQPDSEADSDPESDEVPLSLSARRRTTPPNRNAASKRSADHEEDSDDSPARRRTRRSSTTESDDASTATTSRGPRFYIGKNPSNFRRPLGSGNAALRKASGRADSDSDMDDFFARGSGAAQSSQVSSRPATQSSNVSAELDPMIDWPLWCVYCGTSPTVPERYTTELRQLFPNDVPTLKTMGILHDLHLRILASLSDSRRHAFLLSFVPKKYTQF